MIPLIFTLGILMGAVGGILMKIGARQIGPVEINSLAGMFHFLLKLFTNIPSLFGVFLYFSAAMAWSYLLTKLELSFVQPILALTYVVTPVLAIIFLGEHVTLMRWSGVLVIIAGVYIVARSAA